MIWRTVVSLTRVMGGEAEARNPGTALGEYREQRGPLTNSVARMLATIERQRKELEQFAQRLDRVNRELESTKNRLGEVSFTDDVTGLPDGRAFSVGLEEEMARCRRFDHPLSLVLLDLDDFTSVNADLSREGTDERLRAVAQFLLRSSRAVDMSAATAPASLRSCWWRQGARERSSTPNASATPSPPPPSAMGGK